MAIKKYNHNLIERKWQKYWQDNKIFQVKEDKSKEKFYVLDMFPYPSGEGLHVGHPKGYIATDIFARYMMLKGKNVLHPMGFDSFGLPAENYALKHKIAPQKAVNKNIKRFKSQLEQFGFTYDWNREIITSEPDYYKWTQWIFLEMFKKGLVYESTEPINWCPSCKTGLANEDLEDGKCERCGTQVEKRPMRQWVLKMTDYAEQLLDDLRLVDWEKSIIEQQINWIGKSKGSLIKFKLITDNCKLKTDLNVFTTRADTLYGATYMVVAPENKLISNFKFQISNFDEIKKYIEKAKKKSDLQRTDLAKEKTGVEIKGIKAVNPANNKEIPIFVADYVLPSYGTGAIMAVPAHDERDWEFAKKYHLPIIEVIKPDKKQKLPFIDEGKLINSGKFDGMDSIKARKEITKFICGKEKVMYKMRDWVFSRQRYWGEPFPLVFCKNCAEKITSHKSQVKNNEFNKGELLNPGWIAIKELPVKLPSISHYEPTGTGESPLANIQDWVNTKCPKCGGPAKRETNTMPQWAGSCWYYLAYTLGNQKSNSVKDGLTASKSQKYWDQDKLKYWLEPKGVDLYVGGAEHATRHLLYARFWHKFLFDLGVVSTKEPFYRLKHVGLIRGEDGRKMSKRWGNIVNPDDIIRQFGADAFRMYEMFMGPFADSVAWSTVGVKGTKRFLDKVWKYYQNIDRISKDNKSIENELQFTINKISDDIKKFDFNTSISQLMIFVNTINKKHIKLSKNQLEKFLQILSPFAPHMAEELWSQLGHKESLFTAKWPDVNQILEQAIINIPVMINGKKRALLEIKQADKLSKDNIFALACKDENVQKYTKNKKIKKKIYVAGRIISLVI